MNIFLQVKEICYVQDLESDNFSITVSMAQNEKKIMLRYLNEISEISDDFFQVDGKKEVKLDIKVINDHFNKDELKGNFVVPFSLFDKKQETFSKWISLNNYSKIKNIKGAVKLNLEVIIQYDASNIISKKFANKLEEDDIFKKKSISHETKNSDKMVKNIGKYKVEKNSFEADSDEFESSMNKTNKNNLNSASKIKENSSLNPNRISVEVKGSNQGFSDKQKKEIRDKKSIKIDNSSKLNNTTCPVSSSHNILNEKNKNRITNNLIEEFDGNCEMDLGDIKPNYNILDEELEFNDTFLNSKNEFSLFNSKTKDKDINFNNFDLNSNEYDLINENTSNFTDINSNVNINVNRPVVYTSSMPNIIGKSSVKDSNATNQNTQTNNLGQKVNPSNKLNSGKNISKGIIKQDVNSNANTNINSNFNPNINKQQKNSSTIDSKIRGNKIINDNVNNKKISEKMTLDNIEKQEISKKIETNNKFGDKINNTFTSNTNNDRETQLKISDNEINNEDINSFFIKIKKVQIQDERIKLSEIENDLNTLQILKKNFEDTFSENYIKSIKDDKLILRLESANIIDSYMEIQNSLVSAFKYLVEIKKRQISTQQNLELKNHFEKKKNKIMVKRIQKMDLSKDDFYLNKMNELNKIFFHNALDKNYNDNEFQVNIYKSLMKIYSKIINDEKSQELTLLNENLKRIQSKCIYKNFKNENNNNINNINNTMSSMNNFEMSKSIKYIQLDKVFPVENNRFDGVTKNVNSNKNQSSMNSTNNQFKTNNIRSKDAKLNEIKEEDQAEVLFEKLMELNKDLKYEKLSDPRIYILNGVKIEIKYDEENNDVNIKDLENGIEYRFTKYLDKIKPKRKEIQGKIENNNSLLSSNNQNSFSKKRINTLKSSTSKTTVKK